MLYQSDRLRLECSDGVATLWLDPPSPAGNVLSRSLLRDLDRAIDVVGRCRALDVLVIRSAGPGCFLTGPDLDEYAGLTDADARRAFARSGQATLRRLHDLSPDVATIAYIDGECLNAGMELALACDFRLAVATPETRLGFDYRFSGLLPCWGATQRLPRRVGPAAAVQLLTGGESVPARAARRLGLVDHAFGPRPAKTELWWFVADVQDNRRRPRPRSGWLRRCGDRLWADASTFRPFLRSLSPESQLRPAIEAMRRGWRFGPVEGCAAERAAFVEHAHAPGTANVRASARSRQAHSATWRDVPAPRRIGVSELDERGLRLTLAALAAGGSVVVASGSGADLLKREMVRAVERGWFNVIEAEHQLKHVALATGDAELGQCELVFVTGAEDVLLDLDRRLPSSTILAVPASMLTREILAALVGPERVIGVNRAAAGAVEIVPTLWTEAPAVSALFRWLERCGRRVNVIRPTAVAEPIAA